MVDKLSRAACDYVRVTAGSNSSPGVLGSGRRARHVEQLPQATGTRVGGPGGSTSCLGRLGPVNESPQVRPALQGNSRSCPRARGVDQLSRETQARERGPAVSTRLPRDSRPGPSYHGCRPAVLDDSRLLPRARVFDLLSRAHWARVRWLVCRPAVLDNSSSGSQVPW